MSDDRWIRLEDADALRARLVCVLHDEHREQVDTDGLRLRRTLEQL